METMQLCTPEWQAFPGVCADQVEFTSSNMRMQQNEGEQEAGGASSARQNEELVLSVALGNK